MSDTAYSTQNEIQFIDQLQAKNPDAYKNYRETFAQRKKWGNIDPKAIALRLGINK